MFTRYSGVTIYRVDLTRYSGITKEIYSGVTIYRVEPY